MKSISSSLVVAAGVWGMTASCGAASTHHLFPFPAIAFLGSLVVVALGLVGWWACLKHER